MTTKNQMDERTREAVELMLELRPKQQERLFARLVAAAMHRVAHTPKTSAVYQFAVEDRLDSYQLLSELDADEPPLEECWIEALEHFALFEGDRR